MDEEKSQNIRVKMGSTLNQAQLKAVTHKDGPLLIIAGAGAGKTRTLTERISNLIYSGVRGDSILAVTFTNKAAKEMRERVLHLLEGNRGTGLPWVGTFHALGAVILREFGSYRNISPRFTILDRDDSLSLIKQALKTLGYDPKFAEPKRILERISRAKGSGVERGVYTSNVKGPTAQLASRVWAIYEDLCKKEQSLDFDDLLSECVLLLKQSSEVHQLLNVRWQYVHIDEYQDTNGLQYEFVQLLAGKNKNICVVGDSDQTIYTWRGATIENMLDFEKDFPGATVVTLEENYRSTSNILSAANAVIEKNEKRKPKSLFTKKIGGERISLYEAMHEADEAQYVAKTAGGLMAKGVLPQEIAVLYRTNFQSRALEEAFLGLRVPYNLLGTKFFERKEVKDVLSYLRAARNPSGTLDLTRALTSPSRGIGPKTVEKVLRGEKASLPPKQQKAVGDVFNALDEIRTAMNTLKPSETVHKAMIVSGILSSLEEDEDRERIGNLSELVSLASRMDNMEPEEGMSAFLEGAALVQDQDGVDARAGVRLMTVHAAKGLEFAHVFIVGLEEELFPQQRKGEAEDKDKLEEERRLFYVALTRAKEKLYLSHAAFRTIFGTQQVNVPSSFLVDIDDALIEYPALLHSSPTKKVREKIIFFEDF